MTRRVAIEQQPDLSELTELVRTEVPYELQQDGQTVAVVVGPKLWAAYQEYVREELEQAVAAIRRHGGAIEPEMFPPTVAEAIRHLHEVQHVSHDR